MIDILRDLPSASAWYGSQQTYPFASGLASLEVAFGVRNKADLKRTLEFLNRLETLWPTKEDFLFAIEIVSQFGLSHGTGPIDAVTAAIAIRTNMVLVTFNRKHFEPIPGLRIVTPYSR